MCHHAHARVERSKKRCCVDCMSLLNRGNNLTGKISLRGSPLLVILCNASASVGGVLER